MAQNVREAVRSGRRANFFITENRFIDCYAAKVGGSGVAVYSILQRCANSETRETWISAGKMADILGMDKSTVYRYLGKLEDLRLIRALRTREKTIYVVLPVPPLRPETGPGPLFDLIEPVKEEPSSEWPGVAAAGIDLARATDSYQCEAPVAPAPHTFSSPRPASRKGASANKEEQDELNKTQEQDFFNKTVENGETEIAKAADRVIKILGLPTTMAESAMAAIEFKTRESNASMDEVVTEIWTEAVRAERKNVSRQTTVSDYLSRMLAERILDEINLPTADHVLKTVVNAVKAEAKDAKVSLKEAAAFITNAAIDARREGMAIDIFYFQNMKWRNNGRTGKGQQQFERIKRARDEAHAIIDAEMDR